MFSAQPDDESTSISTDVSSARVMAPNLECELSRANGKQAGLSGAHTWTHGRRGSKASEMQLLLYRFEGGKGRAKTRFLHSPVTPDIVGLQKYMPPSEQKGKKLEHGGRS
jgi:hypothetical protein